MGKKDIKIKQKADQINNVVTNVVSGNARVGVQGAVLGSVTIVMSNQHDDEDDWTT